MERFIALKIQSELPNVAAIGAAIRGLSNLAGLAEEHCYNLELCAVEAVTNSIDHAYEGEGGHDIEVDVMLSSERVKIIVRDQGRSFNQLPIPARQQDLDHMPLLENHEIPFRGRGLFLINELMDVVQIQSGRHGNRLEMTKCITL